MASKYDWLQNLKVGDMVFEHNYHWDHRWTECAVERATPTTITVKGNRYRRKDGSYVGTACLNIVEINQENISYKQQAEAEKERLKLATLLSQFSWKKLSMGTLQQVQEIINAN